MISIVESGPWRICRAEPQSMNFATKPTSVAEASPGLGKASTYLVCAGSSAKVARTVAVRRFPRPA